VPTLPTQPRRLCLLEFTAGYATEDACRAAQPSSPH